MTRWMLLAALAVLSSRPAQAEWLAFGSGLLTSVPRAPDVHVVRSDAQVLELDVTIHGVFALPVNVSGQDMHTLALPGVWNTITPFHPAIPEMGHLLALAGPGARVTVEVLKRQRIDPIAVAPAPHKPKRCGFGRTVHACDPRTYARDVEMPDAFARIEGEGWLRDLRVARLVITPFHYNPARSTLTVATRMRVRCILGEAPAIPIGPVPPSFMGLYRASLLNGAPIVGRMAAAPESILIIAADVLIDAMAPFVDWKRRQGLAVTVTPMSTIGASAKDVLAYLSALPATARPSFVLLVGDANLVPPLYGCLDEDGPPCASDWLFSTLIGDDLYSDVMVSRLSAHTPADVAIQVQRALAFEMTPPTGASSVWFTSATLISSSQGEGESNDDHYCDLFGDRLASAGYTTLDKFYNSLQTDYAASISSSINLGRGILAYFGHGSGTEWTTTRPPYSQAHIASLTNVGRPPVIVDVSCANGAFDREGDCMAESWMKAGTPDAPTGGIVTYSSSTDTSWDPPAVMAQGFAEGITVAGLARWGEAIQYGRTYLVGKLGIGPDVRTVFEQYVQFGDGSLMMRTRPTRTLTVTAPDIIAAGFMNVPVSVREGDQPVPGALVSLRKLPDWEGAAFTNDAGEALLPAAMATPGTAELVVTAQNAFPDIRNVLVVIPECAIVQVLPERQNCSGSLQAFLWDADLSGQDTAGVMVTPGMQPSRAFTLKRLPGTEGAFSGTILVGTGGLEQTESADLRLTYLDQSCQGATSTVSAVVTLDCDAPMVSNVQFVDVTSREARLRFSTNERSTATVQYGPAEPWPMSAASARVDTEHELWLKGLVPTTTYQVAILPTDQVGNTLATAEVHTFTTPVCTPDCTSRVCGDDLCGGSCGPCEPDQTCEEGVCRGGAGCAIKATPGWPEALCEECVCNKDEYCCTAGWDALCATLCEEQCGGCGTGCIPQCDGRTCGFDGCGGTCGTCSNPCTGAKNDPTLCEDGRCVTPCCPDCLRRDCGPDGCGGLCGTCSNPCTGSSNDPDLCNTNSGVCASPCCPDCSGRECGPDGCEGECGACPDHETCQPDGQCEPDSADEANVAEPPERQSGGSGGCAQGRSSAPLGNLLGWMLLLMGSSALARRLRGRA